MENLTQAVRDLEKQVGRLGRAFGRRTWALAVIAAAMVALVTIASHVQADNNRRIRQSEQKWCPIVLLLVAQPGDAPAPTERGRRIADQAAVLADQFHCAKGT